MSARRQATARERRQPPRHGGEFPSELFTYPGKGGWTFATVPDQFAPSAREAWGRTPVRATVDGIAWETSVWREKSGRTLLPVPKRVRGTKGHGDKVRVKIEFDAL
ncbi:MAG TPA: DUF1905 domain-containing protein [Gemmatimonadaceae bacterium]